MSGLANIAYADSHRACRVEVGLCVKRHPDLVVNEVIFLSLEDSEGVVLSTPKRPSS